VPLLCHVSRADELRYTDFSNSWSRLPCGRVAGQVIDVSSDCSPERLQTGKRPIISRKSHSACNEAETNDLRITKAAQTHSDHVVAKTLLGTCEFFGEGTAPAHLIRNELPRFKQLAPLGFQRSIQRPTCRYPVAQSARWFCATRYSQSTLLIPCRAHKFLRATAFARRSQSWSTDMPSAIRYR
jgi:hypothetical protein